MRKLPLFPVLLFFAACSEPPVVKTATVSSEEIEKAALDCWNKHWSDKPGFDISNGINKTDDYLFSQGLLGKRDVSDYRKFFTGTAQIYIPDSVPGSADMLASLNSDFSGNPQIGPMQACWKACWFDKMSGLDSNDVISRIGKLVQELAQSGPPEIAPAADKFFSGLTKEELQRPLVKNIAYFIFWKTSYGQTHIIFSPPEVKSN